MRISYEPKGMQFATQEYIGGFCTIVLHYPCLKLRYTDTDTPRVHPCAQHRYQQAQGNATEGDRHAAVACVARNSSNNGSEGICKQHTGYLFRVNLGRTC